MTHLDEKALSPCPFCASEASADGNVTYSKGHVREQGWEQDTFYFCNCPTCGVSNVGIVGHHTQADAIEAWNRRASPALPSSPVSELVDVTQPIDDIYVRDGFCDWADVANARDEVRNLHATTLTTLSTRNAELEREVKRLREVLTPFASEADELAVGVADDCVYALPRHPDLGLSDFDVGDLRAASRALSTSPRGGEHE